MKKQFTLLLVFLISAFAINAQIYVNAAATPPGDGNSWGTAYTDLQSALADIDVTNEDIWVAAGTYYPTTTTDRTISFTIPDGANIYGGYSGVGSVRDVETYSTILSGAIGFPTPADNTFHVVQFIDVSNATLLDGFVITAGYAYGVGEEDNGGGIYINADAATCEPNISNCKINANHADGLGGGIFIQSWGINACNPIIDNCQITNNSVYNYGGGIYVFGNTGEASPTITNCIISGNSSLTEGGGIVTEAYEAGGICNAEFISCIVSGNEADLGGGMACWGSFTATNNTIIRNCTFSGNNGISGGGAFENWSNDEYDVDINFYNCLIWGNSSVMENLDAVDPLFTYYYCDIEGSSSTAWDATIGVDGGNNIDTNPYFSAPILPSLTTIGNFQNHYASEAIGAGDATEAPINDIDGNPFSTPPSIGAYEYAALPGDWDGATDTDWGTATNWLTGVVATSADDVYLSAKASNMPLVSEPGATPAECNNLELLASTSLFIDASAGLTVHGNFLVEPSASFAIYNDGGDAIGSLITLGNVNGSINTERSINESEWHLIASPVEDQPVNIFLGDYLQTYDESTQLWSEIEDENTLLTLMKGYALWGTPASRTHNYPFEGQPGSGNNTFNFTADNAYGWNLLGNPFPSAIDWDVVTIPPGMNSSVYYLDAATGNYVSYNGGIGTGSRYIPPMQGFWISATTPGTFAVGNSDRSHLGTDTYYKNEKEISNYIALQVQSEDMVDKTYIRFNNEATASFDGKYDAYKLMAPNEIYPQIYTIAGEDKLSISQLPATDVIPVGFYVKNSGNYTISLDKITDIQSCQLEDLKTGIMQDLQIGSYTFTYTEGEVGNRFLLHLSAVSVDLSNAEENIKLYAVGKEVFVKSMNPIEKGTVRVTDLAGRTLIEESISNQNFIRLITNLTTGVYILSVSESSGLRTEKIIIN